MAQAILTYGISMPIVLKDRTGADVTFTFGGTTSNGAIFNNAGASLLARKRLTVSIAESRGAYRVRYKLEQPHVCDGTTDCVASVSYTQVASADVSVVKASTPEDRADLTALIKSFSASQQFADMVNDATVPSM